MFETDDKHLTHKLAYQKPDREPRDSLQVLNGPFTKCNLVFWPRKPGGFVSLGSWEAFDAAC